MAIRLGNYLEVAGDKNKSFRSEGQESDRKDEQKRG